MNKLLSNLKSDIENNKKKPLATHVNFYLTFKNADKIIKALEKQIPKKPILVRCDNSDEKWWYECPICGETSIENYCCMCGQKMDWSEYKEVANEH